MWAILRREISSASGPKRIQRSTLLGLHAGNGDMSDLGHRFVECFAAAADDAGLPSDPGFRAALRAYMEWAVEHFIGYPGRDAAVPSGLPHASVGLGRAGVE